MATQHTREELQDLQALPLNIKLAMTKARLREFIREFGEDSVTISFSGGIDSTVLLDIVRQDYPDVEATYFDTGLEYPENRSFVRLHKNITWLKPSMSFVEVVKKYGYPLISKEISGTVQGARRYLDEVRASVAGGGGGELSSEYIKQNIVIPNITNLDHIKKTTFKEAKMSGGLPRPTLRYYMTIGELGKHYEAFPERDNLSNLNKNRYEYFLDAPFDISANCCYVMKKSLSQKFVRKTGKKPITAEMASESKLRTQKWLEHGCNIFEGEHIKSSPMSFWTQQDVFLYLRTNRDRMLHLLQEKNPTAKIHNPWSDVYGEILTDEELAGGVPTTDFAQINLMELFDAGAPHFQTTRMNRTGCFCCGYGLHLEKEEDSRLTLCQKYSNPALTDAVLRGGKFDERGKWVPHRGFGYWFILEWCNQHGGMKYYIPNREYYIEKYSTPETDRYIKR